MFIVNRDNRNFERHDTLSLADAEDIRESRGERVVVVNISMGGLSFCSSSRFTPGDEVIFHFLPVPFQVYGVVKRVKQNFETFIHGVEFENLSFMNRIKLNRLVIAEV